MELALNLGWALVALWMVCAWLRTTPRKASDRRIQMVALAILILILLPAISMTDDLVALRNPAEIDASARRDHGYSCTPHAIVPATAALPLPVFTGPRIVFAGMAASGNPPSAFVEKPSLVSIQNRPPPAA